MTRDESLTRSTPAVMAELTQRQEQILQLMQQGKVNKEIARELDISLGTVKQHLVAVFKKLNVQNRTMAVARLAEFKDQSGFDAVFTKETLIARRPAIILSLKVPSYLPQAGMKLFHTCLAEIAFDSQALFISREAGDGDLVFGLKRSSAQDIRTAIRVAGHVFKVMKAFVTEDLKHEKSNKVLTGALVAGLIRVSQNRFGGWSGETVGSNLLTLGHKLRDSAATNHLVFNSQAASVMQALNLPLPSDTSNQQLLFSELHSLNRWNLADDQPLVGRDEELQLIDDLLAEKYRILLLEGESGMGKSRLCREAARLALKEDRQLFYINILPSGFFDSEHYPNLEQLGQVFADINQADKSFLVLDDAHHLTLESKTLLVSFLNNLPKGVQVVVCGRQPQRYAINETLHSIYRLIHLNRLDEASIVTLINEAPSHEATDIAAIVERARGIPLFAKELLHSTNKNPISLALMITIASRIDKFKVDWKLLYCVASHDEPVNLEQLSKLMQDDLAYIKTAIEHAETLGVLIYQPNAVSFRHPLVQNIISYLFRPNQIANAISGHQ